MCQAPDLDVFMKYVPPLEPQLHYVPKALVLDEPTFRMPETTS